MITIRRIFAAAFVAVFAAASAVAAGPAPEAQAAAYLEQLWRSSGTPAISIAVASKGRIVYSAGVGFADLENLVPENGSTVYNIGSVSKVITAVAVMQLVEQGKLALDDPIQKYVPAFPEKSPIPITIRHLMTHTSGIRHYRGTDFPNSEDNENTRPSSWEKVSRSSRMIRCCSAPVSITSTPRMPLTFFREWSRGPAVCHSRTTSGATSGGPVRRRPSAQLLLQRSDVQVCERRNDLDGFGAALNRGMLLKPETTAMMYRSQLEGLKRFNEKGPPGDLDFEQGLIWRIFKDPSGRTFINHCGTVKGFNACLVNYPDADLVVALLGNGDETNLGRTPTVNVAQFFLQTP